MAIEHSRTAEKKARFLEELVQRRSVYHACKASELGRRTAYDWRERDLKFAAAWKDALEDATEILEDSLYQRALGGDTTASIFLLKAFRPEMYRDNQHVLVEGGLSLVQLVSDVVSDRES